MLKSLTILISIAATAYVGAIKPDCATLEDGHYAVGCNRVFYRCYLKARYEHVCPEEDLYFDPQRIKCMEKDEVKQCKNERRYAGEIIKAKEFSCKGKKTGDYSHPAIPCDKYYYSCNHGVVHQMLCPPQQYFDERTKTCELKNNVRACLVRHRVAGYLDDPLQGGDDVGSPPGTPPASNSYSTIAGADMPGFEMKQIEVEQTSSTPDCVSRGDSVFEDPSSKCTDFFWKCAHSKLFKYHCPPGLFYDVEFNRCNYKQDIPNCGGTRPTPITTQAPPAQDQAVIEFDCNDKKDGFYPVGQCKSVFVSCSAGSGRQVECSDGLFYDDRISACDYEDKCMGPRMPEKPLPSRPHGDIASDIPPEPKINYDCTGKPDGFYSLSDCNGQYVQCSNGIASVMKCAAGLVYSTYSLNCDYPQKCKETLELPPTTPLPGSVTVPATDFVTTTPKSNQYGETVIIPTMSPTTPTPTPIVTESRDQTTKQGYDLPTYTPSSTTPPALPSNDDPTNFCATKSDGAYAKSVCSQEYVHCWDRLATPAKCHSDLIFNPYNGQCDYRSAVVDCNPGMDQPKTTTSAPSAPVEPFCEMLADGYYATGCSSTFYHCDNRVTRKMNCPPGLFFDTRRGICDRSHNIVACGGRSAAYAKTMPSSAYHQTTSQDAAMPPAPGPMPSPSAYKPPRVIPTSDLTAPTFDCTNRPDGIYALPTCTKFYAQCFGHQTKIQACAEGLWYNEQSGLCDYKERVPICGGSIPTGPAQNPPTATASTYGYNTQPTGFSCQGKADGYYSKGCAQFYYSCISGNTHAMTCPTGLKFSQTQQNCEDDAFVAECGGQPRPTPPALDKPTNLPLFSCSAEKTNGLFEIEKCHGEYAICEHGVYHLGRCLPMLVFNPVTLRCDFKQNTPTCGSMYVPTPAPQVTLPPVQHTSPIGSTECVGKLDGFYAMGACLPNYLQCLKQISYHASCPSVLKFNPANGRCDFVANIPACSIVPTTSAQLQQQSVDVPSRPQAHY